MKSPFSALARRLAPAGLFMCALLFSDRAAQAAEIAQVEFNPGFLHQSDPQQAVDLSLFSKGEYVLPGTYRLDVESAVENAQVAFDLGQQRLNLSIPQIALRQVARGGVDPKEWDTGAAA